MKRVFISGVSGNMGSRYALICKKLGLKVYGADMVSFTEQSSFCNGNDIDGIIVATPTHTHVDAINIFGNQTKLPILVEKPIRCGRLKTMPDFPITMVNQYAYLADPSSVGLTYYNYFKTGGDGLLWDCINIVGLAKSEVSIKKDSVFWRCMINGKRLQIRDMDRAYIEMVKDWTEDPFKGNREYFQKAHDKVVSMLAKGGTGTTTEERNKIKSDSQVIPILGKER